MVDRDQLTKSLSRRRAAFTGLAAFLALAILASGYGIAVQSALSRRAEEENLAANLAQARMGALFVADHQGRLLERLQAIAGRNAFKQAMKRSDLHEIESFLQPLVSRQEEVSAAFLTGPDGACIFSIPALSKGQLRNSIVKNRQPWVSPVQQGPNGKPVVTISAPVGSGQGFMGQLGLHQQPDYWEFFLARLTSRPGRTYHLLDQNGHLVAAGPWANPAQMEERVALAQATRHTLTERGPGAWLVPVPGATWQAFTAAAPVEGPNWSVVVLQDYASAMAPSQTLYRSLMVFLTVMVLCVLLLGWMLHQRYRMQQDLLSRLNEEALGLEAQVAERTAKLAASTERWRSLLEDLPDIVYDLDEQGNVTFVSRSIQQVLGFRPGEVQGCPWRDLIMAEDRGKLAQKREQVQLGAAMSIVALRHKTKGGGIRWLSIHSRGVFDEAGGLVGRRGVARDVTAEVIAQMQVRDLSGRLMRAQEDERKRVALDLHDDMGQILSALKMGLQALTARVPDGQRGEMQRLITLSQNVTDRVRALAYRLRPSILDNFGLGPALVDLCESINEAGLMTVDHELAPLDGVPMNPDQEIVLFRFAQEALTNASKHAGSSKALVKLVLRDSLLRLSVRDWGHGFDWGKALASGRSLGLPGMVERLVLISGRLNIESSSEGTLLTAVLLLGE